MRITWVDNLRWIWILLIVLWHCNLPVDNPITKYLFSFHVVLFFILSWFLFNATKHDKFLPFFKNRVLRLVIPFFAFNIIYFAINKLIWEYSWTTIRDFVWGVSYWDYLGDNWGYYNNTGWFNVLNISTWFLTALFSTSIYYYFLHKFVKNRLVKIFIVLALSLAVYFESKATIFRMPWALEISVVMLLFYTLWNIFKKEITSFVEKIDYRYLLLIPIILLIHFWLINPVNVSINQYWNYPLMLINSFLWFVTVLIISKLIWKNKVLEFFWKNSIIILWFEWIKIFAIKHMWLLSIFIAFDDRTYLFWFFQFFLTIICLVPIIYIVNNLFPFVLGGWYKKK